MVNEVETAGNSEINDEISKKLCAARKAYRSIRGKFKRSLNFMEAHIEQHKEVELLKKDLEKAEALQQELIAKFEKLEEVMDKAELEDEAWNESQALEDLEERAQKLKVAIHRRVWKESQETCTQRQTTDEDEQQASGSTCKGNKQVTQQDGTQQVKESVPPLAEKGIQVVNNNQEQATKEEKVSSRPNHEVGNKVITNELSLNPNAYTFAPAAGTADMYQILESISMHKAEPPLFHGNPLEYNSWKIAFRALVESDVKNETKLYYYLLKYTAGEAKELVNTFISTDPSTAYKSAREELETRYGDPYLIATTLKTRLENWPAIKPGDSTALRSYADFLKRCHVAKGATASLSCLDDEDRIRSWLKKLPAYIVNKWNEQAFRISESTLGGMRAYPSFKQFEEFIQLQARQACFTAPAARVIDQSSRANAGTEASNIRGARSFSTNATDLQNTNYDTEATDSRNWSFATDAMNSNRGLHTRYQTCVHCNEGHTLNTCIRFSSLPVSQRKEVVKEKRLCLNCLRQGHMVRDCGSSYSCRICRKYHHTLLHEERSQEEERNHVEESAFAYRTGTRGNNRFGGTQSLILPIWVYSSNAPGNRTITYALLDHQSNTSFIKRSLFERLSLKGGKVNLSIKTISGTEHSASTKCKDLVIKGLKKDEEIHVNSAYVREDIAADRSAIPSKRIAGRYVHLRRLCGRIESEIPSADIELLIGLDVPQAIEPLNVVTGKTGEPFGYQTRLGWGIIGRTSNASEDIRKTSIEHTATSAHSIVAFRTQVKEIYNLEDMRKVLESDFVQGCNNAKPYSQEDKQFIRTMQEEIIQEEDGHYKLPLPLKSQLTLPNNKVLALSRLQSLKRKLKGNPALKTDYDVFMATLIKRGYAELVPHEELAKNAAWFLPHHGVYHPRKPNKVRVVFDASAKYHGISLNDKLLQGPDLTSTLTGVLCRFRMEPVAFICDVEAMFHQVQVKEEHKDYLRFLWWAGGELDSPPREYRMAVHIFGARSSPSVCNFTFRHNAKKHKEELGEEAYKFITQHFYVDDGIYSTPTSDQAIEVIKRSKEVCAKGGFNLCKFLSNSKEVMLKIPEEDRSTGGRSYVTIEENEMPIERTLGVVWEVAPDQFSFKIKQKDDPLTRRGILSSISSVYDPLGYVSPFILKGKKIMQLLSTDKADWDDPIPEELQKDWEDWKGNLHRLEEIKIVRCLKGQDTTSMERVELHHFADASQTGYGQCSYLRSIGRNGSVHCNLVLAKSRVAPLKTVTIPRLELQAAVLSVRVACLLREELKIQIDAEFYWTDSTTVLGYINNDSRRFHVFVANRISEIRETSSPEQWLHIDSASNPADIASRGAWVEELLDNGLWWRGPNFLSKNSYTPAPRPTPWQISSEDPEIKAICHATKVEEEDLLQRLEYFSSWFKTQRAVATILKVQRKRRNPALSKLTTAEELADAKKIILRLVQQKHFAEELSILGRDSGGVNLTLPRTSPIQKLDPFIGKDNIMRVGGRIRRADFPEDFKHPIILPKDGHITRLLIEHHHEAVKHSGKGITLNEIRANGYWIISGPSTISKAIHRCVLCRRLRAKTETQKMADLPKDRLEPGPAFTYCAVDYFGPWFVKNGRKEEKRYGALFTCLASRAIHLEVARSLDTDSFINTYRRFVCRRGPVRLLRCDNGTNFVGARNELDKEIAGMNNSRIQQELLKENCDWIPFQMNPPHASHMGGVWERQIRTARSILSTMLFNHGRQLDDESLATFMAETEAIINNRPLTIENISDPQNEEPLTPNHLLTMKSRILMPPPGEFGNAVSYSKRRWKRVQHLADEFWSRWKKDFLQTLQSRQKWTRGRRNVAVGDIVVLRENESPRNDWKLAIVVKADADRDDRVRRIEIRLGDPRLDEKGRRIRPPSVLERPVHSVAVLIEVEDQESPPKEPFMGPSQSQGSHITANAVE